MEKIENKIYRCLNCNAILLEDEITLCEDCEDELNVAVEFKKQKMKVDGASTKGLQRLINND